MDTINHKVFKFEGFLLDARGRSLRNGAHDIKLRPKSFDVLCVLVANAGRLLTKDEVINAVWPNVTVTDESLAQCVSDIRLALHDREHHIIKTVPRRGYVFATPVLRAAIDDCPEPPLASAIEKPAAATRRDGRLAAIVGHLASSPMRWLTFVALVEYPSRSGLRLPCFRSITSQGMRNSAISVTA
jgi:DNA-binding winged helix-turn-helix (wHTH) protein